MISLEETYRRHDIEKKISEIFAYDFIPHALMLDGFSKNDMDVGLNVAKIIASRLVCRDKEKPCFKCLSCQKVDKDQHPDVMQISQNSSGNTISVDEIRNLRRDAFVIPNEADYKVYIIYNAESMTLSAQNALLKVLEEPPANVIFILVCTSSLDVLRTIRSRCHIFSFSLDKSSVDSEELENAIKSFVRGLVSEGEWELMVALSRFIKDKSLFKHSLDVLIDIFSDAIKDLFGVTYENSTFYEEVKSISSKYTEHSIARFIKLLEDTNHMLDQNVNMNLLTTFICSNLKSFSRV